MRRHTGAMIVLSFIGLTTVTSAVYASGEFIWPISGRITSTWRYPDGSIHSGSADIANVQWTPIGAGRFGTARPSWETNGCGNYVYIGHASGYSTLYCHMVQWPSVRSGQYVNTNQVIGYVGTTGHSTGPHCHYAIKRYGVRLIIPGIWIGERVTRAVHVPGTYSGLGGTTASSAPAPSAPAGLFRAKVTVSSLNVRTGPGTGYSIVGRLGYGTVVTVYATSGSWYKILYGGAYRWCAGWYTVRV